MIRELNMSLRDGKDFCAQVSLDFLNLLSAESDGNCGLVGYVEIFMPRRL